LSSFVFVTDSHVRGTSPVSRIDNSFQTVLDKLTWVVQESNRLCVDAIIHGGDLFDSPNPSEDVAGRVAGVLRLARMPVFVVPGNHDLFGYNIRSLAQTKLGLLERAGVLRIICREFGPISVGDFLIQGQEYHSSIDHGRPDDWLHPSLIDGIKVLVYHGMLLERSPGFDMPHTLISQADQWTNANLILAGHYHPGWAPVINSQRRFYNPGSLFRNDASIGNRTRMPKILHVKSTSASTAAYTVTPIAVPALPGDEVITIAHLNADSPSDSILSFKETLKSLRTTGNEEDLLTSFLQHTEEEIRIKINNAMGQVPPDRDSLSSKSFTELSLTNFQSHPQTALTLAPGITAFIGPSNAGKTSILRALRWAISDQPRGAGFLRQGSKEVKVTLQTSVGNLIERSRTASSAGVLIVDGTDYKGFARNLPPELKQAHSVDTLQSNGQSLQPNLSMQHDGPFLLNLSPIQRAQAVAPLGGAGRIESAIRLLSTEETRFNTQLRNLVGELTTLGNRMEELKHVPEELELVEQLLELYDQIERLENLRARVSKVSDRFTAVRGLHVDQLKHLSTLPAKVHVDVFLFDLDYLVNRIKSAKLLLDRSTAVSANYNAQLGFRIPSVAGYIDRLTDLVKNRAQASALLSRITTAIPGRRQIDDQTEELLSHTVKLQSAYDQLIESGATCPVCAQTLPNRI
jgi:DNA repair exonuclease SbcCD nuclease subunit